MSAQQGCTRPSALRLAWSECLRTVTQAHADGPVLAKKLWACRAPRGQLAPCPRREVTGWEQRGPACSCDCPGGVGRGGGCVGTDASRGRLGSRVPGRSRSGLGFLGRACLTGEAAGPAETQTHPGPGRPKPEQQSRRPFHPSGQRPRAPHSCWAQSPPRRRWHLAWRLALADAQELFRPCAWLWPRARRLRRPLPGAAPVLDPAAERPAASTGVGRDADAGGLGPAAPVAASRTF